VVVVEPKQPGVLQRLWGGEVTEDLATVDSSLACHVMLS
jgi:hypothetical protein